MNSRISLIIPSQNAEKNLLKLLSCIPDWKVLPNEIIIVDSSYYKLNIPKYFEIFAKNRSISLVLIHRKGLYPGHARNIGIQNSNNDLLAFLDTSTLPKHTWLSSGLEIINRENSDGIWGKTYYEADSYITKIYKASTYGDKPIKTFPGSILKKSVFEKCGQFIETTRAGEDGDWMSRVLLHKVNISIPSEILNYDELKKLSFKQFLKKWFRNYTHASRLPYSRAHRNFYYYGLSFLSIVIAFNWNAVLASWDTESALYVPNITKLSIFALVTVYIVFRGIFLPRKKGVSLKFIFPFNFLFISIFSGVLDLIKIMAFIFSRIKA